MSEKVIHHPRFQRAVDAQWERDIKGCLRASSICLSRAKAVLHEAVEIAEKRLPLKKAHTGKRLKEAIDALRRQISE